MGSLFANCFESDHNGEIAGMASREFQEQFYGEISKSVEGIQKKAEKNISLESLITEFCWNMRSGFTYCNAKNINELHQNAEFILRGANFIK
jgi:IMP dehydrogenase